MIELITDRAEWKNAISLLSHYDFYHTYSYHELSKKEDESPMMIKYRNGKDYVLLPLLLRPIIGTKFSDATSVYGYAGSLFGGEIEQFDNSTFRKELEEYFRSNDIVTVFSRLHPYIDYQQSVLIGIGEIKNPGNVVNIDLTLPTEIQRQGYSGRLKTYLNKARKSCSVYRGTTDDDIQLFIKLYHENMQRVNANSSYFFEERYFYKLMLSPDFETELLLCKLITTNEVIGGAIFIKTNNIVQYHLSGSTAEYLHLGAVKLIIDEMRIRATEQKYRYFNLGGGKANREDSLFAFKASFSKNLRPFKLWKYVVDQDIYESLIERELQRVRDTMTDADLEYFPAYRILPQITVK